MAEDGLLHTAEILKSVLPYVDVRSKLTLDLLVKLYELIICLRNYRSNDITACGFEKENEKVDMETLLNNIRPKCNDNERSFVDKMLNIFQAKRMFEMYNTYMEAMKVMQGFEGFGGGDDGESGTDGVDSGSFMNNFKDFDFSSILEESNFNAEAFSDIFKEMASGSTDQDEYNSSYKDNTYFDESDPEETVDYNYNSTPGNDIVDETNEESISDNSNSSMFDSLKAMIPSEQMGTFENLRMLFDSMSYDDNNKSDENKE